ncbi:hypothetical protein ACWDCB_40505 [Streptomyces sp. NPDC001178]
MPQSKKSKKNKNPKQHKPTTGQRTPLAASEANGAPPVTSIELTPAFKLVFSGVVIITIASLAVGVTLALINSDNEGVKSVLSVVMSVFQLGAGAMFGLLGGKAM